MRCNVAVLVSGSGTNLQAILDAERTGNLGGAKVRLVLANKADAYGLERARMAGVRAEHVSVKTEGSFDGVAARMLQLFAEEEIDLIVLAGYLKLVHPEVVKKYHRRIINIHPALLPKFGGTGMYGLKVHKAVLEAGEKFSGPSVHFVDEIFDHGTVIAQRKVPVDAGDTPESLQARVLVLEHQILPETIRKLAGGEIPLGDKQQR
jgi:phosphoribosylglycinamide formyltransferase-1